MIGSSWGRMAYERVQKHEEECNRRWDFARQETKETRAMLAEKFEEAMEKQTIQIERLTTMQNRLMMYVGGGVISLLLSILGMLLHKNGAL